MIKNNAIFLIVGESGSGKTTIADLLEGMYGLRVLKSYTTRPPRQDDLSHTFITDEEFNKLKDIIAYTEYNGFKYCATANQINTSDLYVIDPSGIETLKNSYHGNKKLIDIYIRAPEETRAKRMENRGDSDEQIKSRLEYDRKAFANYNPTYIIDNNTGLCKVVDKVKKIIDQYD